MTDTRTPIATGGCQCGAIRYTLYSEPQHPVICHCRMCQKAYGSFFAPFASVALEHFAWTRGAPAQFSSSQILQRGFCGNCGTPLSCHTHGTSEISLSIGSFDEPEKLQPTFQAGVEGRMPWFDQLATQRGKPTDQLFPKELLDSIENRQHPDHDTGDWPLKK